MIRSPVVSVVLSRVEDSCTHMPHNYLTRIYVYKKLSFCLTIICGGESSHHVPGMTQEHRKSISSPLARCSCTFSGAEEEQDL
jgi:hypothetical protein